jgi:hypothetical protein
MGLRPFGALLPSTDSAASPDWFSLSQSGAPSNRRKARATAEQPKETGHMADDFNQQYSDPPFGLAGDYASTGAPGMAPPYPVPGIEGTTASSALVTPFASGYQNADRVPVGADDSQVPAQTDLYAGSDADPLSGMAGNAVGYTGAGTGSDITSGHHPNAAGR